MSTAIVESREVFGDMEADTVLGKQGSWVLVTLAVRKSRLYLVMRVQSKQADVVCDAIIEMLRPVEAITPLVRTVPKANKFFYRALHAHSIQFLKMERCCATVLYLYIDKKISVIRQFSTLPMDGQGHI